MSTHTLSILAQDEPRVLARICTLFAHKKINVVSIGATAETGSRFGWMSVVIDVPNIVSFEHAIKQLNKLIGVVKAVELTPGTSHQRKLVLVKVTADPSGRIQMSGGKRGVTAGTRSEVIELAAVFNAEVIEVSRSTITVQIASTSERIAEFLAVLEPLGICEVRDSGVVSILRGARRIATPQTDP